MPVAVLVGRQWGDEGKGKIIDLLARDADFVVRYQGGSNAGHTVIVGEEKYVLHLIPSGILHPGKINVVANGVALDPLTFMDEVDGLRERGISVEASNLRLSTSAHVILDHHRKLDGLSETWRGGGRIGTTGRGIGPCYADKASRTGLRVSDLLEPDRCRERLSAALLEKNALFTGVYDSDALELKEQVEKYVDVGERLSPFACDSGAFLRESHAEGKSLLFEGAQGVMLDIDHGTYPYVTSSNTGANGIPSGAGFPARERSTASSGSPRPTARAWVRGPSPPRTTVRGASASAVRATSLVRPPDVRAAAAGSTASP